MWTYNFRDPQQGAWQQACRCGTGAVAENLHVKTKTMKHTERDQTRIAMDF